MSHATPRDESRLPRNGKRRRVEAEPDGPRDTESLAVSTVTVEVGRLNADHTRPVGIMRNLDLNALCARSRYFAASDARWLLRVRHGFCIVRR